MTNSERKRLWRLQNKDRVREYNRRYNALHPNFNSEALKRWRKLHPETRRAVLQEWRKKNPEKNKAHDRVQKNGIKHLPCEVCGGTPTHRHHDDYSQPLKVRHLCIKHHRQEHKKWHEKHDTKTE